jgi:single-strand DNA-binding protein
MQKWIASGRLTRDPEVRYSQGDKSCCFAKFTIAVNRRFKRDNEPDADFINCTAFGKTAEIVEKYFTKGMKMEIVGEIRTGSYTNKDGAKVYTTEIAVEEVGFAESKQNGNSGGQSQQASGSDGFMNIEDGSPEELPFS